jgi:hypothetical protein
MDLFARIGFGGKVVNGVFAAGAGYGAKGRKDV